MDLLSEAEGRDPIETLHWHEKEARRINRKRQITIGTITTYTQLGKQKYTI